MAKAQKIAVIGAGIVGASIAYHLQRAGAEVVVLEAGPEPGGVATPASFAWINASMDWSKAYFDLRMCSMALWRRLGGEIAGLEPIFCGSIGWERDGPDLETYVATMQGWGYPIRIVTNDEMRRREPAVANRTRLMNSAR